jgi:hypothetical protein
LEGFPVTSEENGKRSESPDHPDLGETLGGIVGNVAPALPVGEVGLLMLLLLLILGGVAILFYFMALAFLNLITFGEVHRASEYCDKVTRYRIWEPIGCSLAGKLTKLNLYFTAVLFVLTAEEVIRYILHTGPATASIWMFRISCFAALTLILGLFLVRFSKWLNFKSRPEYLRASNEIRQYEKESIAAYEKMSSFGEAHKSV